MPDSQQRSAGDTGYDPTTDPDSPQYGQGGDQGSGGESNWWQQNAPPPQNAAPGAAPTDANGQPIQGNQGGIGGIDYNAAPGTSGGDLDLFQAYLYGGQYGGNTQAAVDAFNRDHPNNTLKPAYYPNAGKGVIGVQGQALPYLTAPGTTAGQTQWQFGGVPWGDSGRGTLADGSLIAPFTGAAPAPRQTPGFNYPSFSPPSAQDVLTSDPGYQFRKDQGQGAIANRFAAQGILNTGGAEKGFIDYNQSAASQEYANAFQRALGIYGTNYQTALGSQQQNFNQNTTSNNYDFNKYLNDQNVFWTNQNGAFNKLFSVSGQGLQAASQS